MAYSTIPPNPAFRARWDAWANILADNVRELVTDVPAMKTQVTQATTRVSQAETEIAALQAQQGLAASNASTALSTAQSASSSAAAAQTAAQTAQASATQAASDAATSAGQVSGLASTVGTHNTQISALTSGKVDVSALATVALTGRYVDLIGAPASGGTAATVTSFTGVANGAAWPSPWTAGQTPTGGSVTVQGEKGQLVTGSTVGNYDSAAGASARFTTQVADFTATWTFRRVGNVHCRLVMRCNATSLDPQDGVIVNTNGPELSIVNVANYTYTQAATVTKTWTKGIDYKVKVTAAGTSVKAKAWVATDPEPAAWDVTGTVARTASGYLGFWAGTDAAAASQTATFDDITIDTGTASSGGGEPTVTDLLTVYNAAKA